MAKIWEILKEENVGKTCKIINKDDIVGCDIKYEEGCLPYTISTNRQGNVGIWYSGGSNCVIEIQSSDIMILDFELEEE